MIKSAFFMSFYEATILDNNECLNEGVDDKMKKMENYFKIAVMELCSVIMFSETSQTVADENLTKKTGKETPLPAKRRRTVQAKP